MGTAKLVKWGNSVGIRISVNEMAAANVSIGTTFKISITKKGEFLLQPLQNPQEGWLEAFNNIADGDNDKSLVDGSENNFDKDEWTW